MWGNWGLDSQHFTAKYSAGKKQMSFFGKLCYLQHCRANCSTAADLKVVKRGWRPVRESNPCRRREREAINGNSRKLRGMGSSLPHLTDSRERLLDS